MPLLRSPSGELVRVDDANTQQFIQAGYTSYEGLGDVITRDSGGFSGRADVSQANPDEVVSYAGELEDKSLSDWKESQDSIGNQVQGFFRGVDDMLLFGAAGEFSDWVDDEYGVSNVEAAQLENQEGARTVGRVAGAGLSVLGGGAGGLAKVAPGAAVSGAAAKIGGRVAARTGSKILGAAVDGAVTGAGWSIGQQATKALAGDPNVTAESIASAALKEGALGGLFGGGFAAAGKVAGKLGGSKLAKQKLPNVTKGLNDDIVKAVDDTHQLLKTNIDDVTQTLRRVNPKAANKIDSLAFELRKTVGTEITSPTFIDDLAKLNGKELNKAATALQRYGAAIDDAATKAGMTAPGATAGGKKLEELLNYTKVPGTAQSADWLEAAAVLETAGVTNFVPDGTYASYALGLVAAKKAGATVAGKAAQKGLRIPGMDKALGLGSKIPGVRSVQQAAGTVVSKIQSGARKFARGTAAAAKASEKYHAAVPLAVYRSVSESSLFYDPKDKVRVSGGEYKQQAAKAIHSIVQTASDPARLQSRVRTQLGPQAIADPSIAGLATQATLTKVNYLAAKAPALAPRQPWEPAPPAPSDTELDRYARIINAVYNPADVLSQGLERGTISLEEVDAIKATSPSIYEMYRQEVMQQIIDSGNELGYQQRILLGLMFDFPSDASMQPDMISFIQNMLSEQVAASQAQPGPGNSPITTNEQPTPTQKMQE